MLSNQEIQNRVWDINQQIIKLRTDTHKAITGEQLMCSSLEELQNVDIVGKRLLKAQLQLTKLHNFLVS